MNLRMAFVSGWEGRVERKRGRQDHGRKVGGGMVVMTGDDKNEMDEGMNYEKGGTCHGGGPINGAPGARRQRQARDQECRADVLDEMRVKRAGVRYPRNAFPPDGTGKEHHHAVDAV